MLVHGVIFSTFFFNYLDYLGTVKGDEVIQPFDFSSCPGMDFFFFHSGFSSFTLVLRQFGFMMMILQMDA